MSPEILDEAGEAILDEGGEAILDEAGGFIIHHKIIGEDFKKIIGA